jgi:hypothetical protein
VKLKINTDGFEGYAKRALGRARKLDPRERIKPGMTPPVRQSASDARSAYRRANPACAKGQNKVLVNLGPGSFAGARIHKSVRRDVLKLERAGVARTQEQTNPGP